MLNKNLDPGISKRTRNSSVTMVNLNSFPDGKSALLTGHTGMTVILYLRGLWPHFTAKRSKQILRSVLQLQILRSLEAANSPTLPLVTTTV